MKLFDSVNIFKLYGGQAEGQFFQKHIFKKISDLYLTITNNNEHFIEFEAEEIIPQIIYIRQYSNLKTFKNHFKRS